MSDESYWQNITNQFENKEYSERTGSWYSESDILRQPFNVKWAQPGNFPGRAYRSKYKCPRSPCRSNGKAQNSPSRALKDVTPSRSVILADSLICSLTYNWTSLQQQISQLSCDNVMAAPYTSNPGDGVMYLNTSEGCRRDIFWTAGCHASPGDKGTCSNVAPNKEWHIILNASIHCPTGK